MSASDFDCPVCLCEFTAGEGNGTCVPALLVQCGHSICRTCLDSIWQHSAASSINCPVCRQASNYSSGVVKHLFLERKIKERAQLCKSTNFSSCSSSSFNFGNSSNAYATVSVARKRSFHEFNQQSEVDTPMVFEAISSIPQPAIAKGRLVSGKLRTDGSFQLEGYPHFCIPADSMRCLRQAPVDPSWGCFRVLVDNLTLRYMPSAMDWGPEGAKFSKDDIVVARCRLRGESGDIVIRTYHAGTGKYGWLLCSKNDTQYLVPVEDTSAHNSLIAEKYLDSLYDEEEGVLDVGMVEAVAASLGYRVHRRNTISRVLSFCTPRSTDKVNVYYSTGTVGTVVDHPQQGRTQLFRRNVSIVQLASIFANPRVHTGVGYRTLLAAQNMNIDLTRPGGTANCCSDTSIDMVLDEQTEMIYELNRVDKMIAMLCEQRSETLKQFQASKLEIVRQQAEKLQQKQQKEERQRQQRERERKLAADAEAARVAAAEAEAARVAAQAEAAQAARVAAARTHALALMGNDYEYRLNHSDGFPNCLDSYPCVAIGQGGFFAVREDGLRCFHSSMPAVNTLMNNHKTHLKYISISGHHSSRYYISKTNGKTFYSVPVSMEEMLDRESCTANLVAFGPDNSYYCRTTNGKSQWSTNIAEKAQEIFKTPRNSIRAVYLGRNLSYFVAYDDQNGVHKMSYNGLPKDVARELSKKNRLVTQVLIDYDNNDRCYYSGDYLSDDCTYFVRFTENYR